MSDELQTAVETRALEIAMQALTRIEVHEKACIEERAAMRHAIERLYDRFTGLDSRWLAVAGIFILQLFAMLSGLFMYFGSKGVI